MVVDVIGAIDRLEIEAGGLTFTGRACGPHEGRKILLLHGFPQTSWCWRAQATCSVMRAPQLGHTPPRLTTRSASHSGHSILVRSGIAE